MRMFYAKEMALDKINGPWNESDEDIHAITPAPITNEDAPAVAKKVQSNEIRIGPITRARAQQLNYQVKSFLAVQTNYPPNEVLLNPCDDFLMIRNLKYEPDWRMEYNDNKQVEGGMRKGRIGPKN